jgi:hypothetical protein
MAKHIYKSTGKKSLFDKQFSVEKLSEMGNLLDKLSTAINFVLLRQVLEIKLLNTAKKNNAVAKTFDVVLMFKILILQRYYGLGDSQVEYQIE